MSSMSCTFLSTSLTTWWCFLSESNPNYQRLIEGKLFQKKRSVMLTGRFVWFWWNSGKQSSIPNFMCFSLIIGADWIWITLKTNVRRKFFQIRTMKSTSSSWLVKIISAISGTKIWICGRKSLTSLNSMETWTYK